ncbi:MAG TPA: hypothetical protein VJT80_05145 [Steroidobacteraceae bacterium]|nr:hypothetical protein [Steroidobacteraceae bacterium]
MQYDADEPLEIGSLEARGRPAAIANAANRYQPEASAQIQQAGKLERGQVQCHRNRRGHAK